MRFISEAYSLSKLYLTQIIVRLNREKWYGKNKWKGVAKKKKQRAIMLREYKHRHAIVRGKKWDKIILCEICVGPTGHISEKHQWRNMLRRTHGSIGMGKAREELIEVGREEKDKS